jgi:hypothetical protein
MRPKVVILTLLVVVGLVAAMAILKGARQPAVVNPTPAEDVGMQADTHENPQEQSSTNGVAQAPIVDPQSLVQKITDIQAEGSPTPGGRAVLLAALSESKEKEVRQAALNAIVQLDDTAAIPGLEQALAQIADPREKAAVMDAVDQLKLPSTTPEVAVSGNMRSQRPPGAKIKHNPRFTGTNPRVPNSSLHTVRPPSQSAASPDAGQAQPAAPAAEAGQPQSPAPQ